jgi:hypothetical protein
VPLTSLKQPIAICLILPTADALGFGEYLGNKLALNDIHLLELVQQSSSHSVQWYSFQSVNVVADVN